MILTKRQFGIYHKNVRKTKCGNRFRSYRNEQHIEQKLRQGIFNFISRKLNSRFKADLFVSKLKTHVGEFVVIPIAQQLDRKDHSDSNKLACYIFSPFVSLNRTLIAKWSQENSCCPKFVIPSQFFLTGRNVR